MLLVVGLLVVSNTPGWKVHMDRGIEFEKQLDEAAVRVQLAKLSGNLPVARQWMAKESKAHQRAGVEVTKAAKAAKYSTRTAFGDIAIAVSNAGRDHMYALAKTMSTKAERDAAKYVAQAENKNVQGIQSAIHDTGRKGAFSPRWREMSQGKMDALRKQYDTVHRERESSVRDANTNLGAYFQQANDKTKAGSAQEMREVSRAANEATAVAVDDVKLAKLAQQEMATAKKMNEAEDEVVSITSSKSELDKAGHIEAEMGKAEEQGKERLVINQGVEGTNKRSEIKAEMLANEVTRERQQRLRAIQVAGLTLQHHHHAHRAWQQLPQTKLPQTNHYEDKKGAIQGNHRKWSATGLQGAEHREEVHQKLYGAVFLPFLVCILVLAALCMLCASESKINEQGTRVVAVSQVAAEFG
jgi:hypothetical protein